MNELAKELGLSDQSLERSCDDPVIIKHVYKSIKHVCKQNDFKIREIPVRITLVKEEWSQDNNLLTAAFKLKRKQVNDYYSTEIRQMFEAIQTQDTISQNTSTVATTTNHQNINV